MSFSDWNHVLFGGQMLRWYHASGLAEQPHLGAADPQPIIDDLVRREHYAVKATRAGTEGAVRHPKGRGSPNPRTKQPWQRPGHRLEVPCWCGRIAVHLHPTTIAAGVTMACGRPRCNRAGRAPRVDMGALLALAEERRQREAA